MTTTPYEDRLFIDGEFREAKSGKRYDVINPADESVVATAADAGPEEISGVGSEHGLPGFRDYLRIKTIASPAK